MKRIALFILIAVLIFSVFTINANAASFGIPFGGKILSVTYCTCSFSLLLTIGSPRPGTFVYIPGISTIYKWFNIFSPGAWALGTSSGFATCFVYAGTSCVPVGGGPTIRLIGTSPYSI